MAPRYQNRKRVLEAVIPQLFDSPHEQLSMSGIADAAGISLWALRYNFCNLEGLIEAVSAHLVDRILVAADDYPPATAVVIDSIESHARFVSDLVRRPEYLDWLYLVMRNGRNHPRLRAVHEAKVVGKICSNLEAIIRDSGARHGITVLLKEHAARRFHRRIEAGLALGSLLEPEPRQDPKETERLIKNVVLDTFEATYVFAWEEATAA